MSNRIAVNKHELSSDLTRNLMAIKTDTLEKGVQRHRIASQWKVKLTASCPISLDMIGQLEVSRRAARDPWWPVVKPWSLVSVLMWASLFASSQYIPWNMGKAFFEKWELSWCRVCHHWWHCRLSERQPAMPPVMPKLASWQVSVFSVCCGSFCCGYINVLSGFIYLSIFFRVASLLFHWHWGYQKQMPQW